jgi:Flp pilus assembly pilin Flp
MKGTFLTGLDTRERPRLTRQLAESSVAKGEAMDLPLSGAGGSMFEVLRNLWFSDEGQDLTEYAVLLAVILVIAAGSVAAAEGHANHAFSAAVSAVRDCFRTR